MDIEDALRWVDTNCYDEATVQRLRSRKVARTLADEIERLRAYVAHLAVPVGHKLVPIRPTLEMLTAGYMAREQGPGSIYAAMIEQAPDDLVRDAMGAT